jgi:cupin 2 domain-containing protein
MPSNVVNLFAGIPASLEEELTDGLVRTDAVRIERIVSRGHASPPGFWYDQPESEWIVLLIGGAELAFADGETVALTPGDWIDIPAHRKHRIERTDPDRETVWLVVFYR